MEAVFFDSTSSARGAPHDISSPCSKHKISRRDRPVVVRANVLKVQATVERRTHAMLDTQEEGRCELRLPCKDLATLVLSRRLAVVESSYTGGRHNVWRIWLIHFFDADCSPSVDPYSWPRSLEQVAVEVDLAGPERVGQGTLKERSRSWGLALDVSIASVRAVALPAEWKARANVEA